MKRLCILILACVLSLFWTNLFNSWIPDKALGPLNLLSDATKKPEIYSAPEYLHQQLAHITVDNIDHILINNQPDFSLKTLDHAHTLGDPTPIPLKNLKNLNSIPSTTKEGKVLPPEEDPFLRQIETQFIQNP